MSLVNEALKRTEEERRQRLAGVTPPGPPGADYGPPPQRGVRHLLLWAGAALAISTVAAYGIWWVTGWGTQEATAGASHPTRQTAAAPATVSRAEAHVSPPAQPQDAPQDQGGATPEAPSTGAVATAEPTRAAPAGPDPQIDPDLVKQIAKSVIAQMAPPPAAGRHPKAEGKTDPAPGAGDSTAPEPSEPPTAPTVVDPTAVAPGAGAQTGKPAVAPGKAQQPTEPKPKPPPQPAEKKPAPPVLPLDTSHLKISSIVSGPQGGTAIINGRPVQVGDTVGNAKIIAITPRMVEVEIDGRRALLPLG